MRIKLIKKNNEGVEIKSGENQGGLRYTPAAKSVAQKLGKDLLMAILAAASDEAWSQADEYEWKDAVDTDHGLEWNTCQALGWGFDDMGADAPFKGDSGKVYSGAEAKNSYNAIAALGDDDRYSLFFNNQPRNYSHIRDVVATAMDMAEDGDGDDDWERRKKGNEGASQNESIGAVTRNPGNRYKESFMIDCGTPENALALADAMTDEAYGHPAGGELDDAGRHFLGGELIQCWPVGHFFTASVDPCEKAIAWCRNFLKDLGGSAPV